MFCIKYFDFSWKHHIITSVLYTLLAVVIIVIAICLCKNTDTELGMHAEV